MSLSYTLGVIVIFECLLTAFFLMGYKSSRRLSNAFLTAFFLSIAFSVTDGLLFVTGTGFRYPQLVFWGNAFSFLLAPLLYWYTCSLAVVHFKLCRKDLLHLLPFLVVLVLLVTSYHLQPRSLQLEILEKRRLAVKVPVGVFLTLALNYLQIVGYVAASFRVIRRYRLKLMEQFSSFGQRDLAWLKNMLTIFAGVVLISFVNSIAEFNSQAPYYSFTLVLVIVVILLFLVNVLQKALRQPSLFSGVEENGAPISLPAAPVLQKEGNAEAIKYGGSSLNRIQAQTYYDQLVKLMEEQKPYLDPEISLSELAKKARLPAKTLSQVINDQAGKSFFEFINSYRIGEAQRLLSGHDKKITVLEVLYQVGFNSKSSFNTAFKKATGVTPSAYKKEKQGLG